MLFNSFIFILMFLPLSIAGYFLLNKRDHRMAEGFLLVMSLFFYAFNYPPYLLIILASIVVNYTLSRLMISAGRRGQSSADTAGNPLVKKIIFAAGILFNVGILGYYKYLDFTLWNINMVFGLDIALRNVVLPLGISFYTIQQLSYMIDTYKGDEVNYSFPDYALYVSFFPQLVAGPIVYHSELVPQIRDRGRQRINPENLMKGIIWFTRGLAKKVFLADRLGAGVQWGYGDVAALTSLDAWLVMICYSFQLYFDFSGYSDMACGIAQMFNFELPQNFNSPYKSLSIRDFWKRWHMTLTRFLTRYLYIPLGGNRKGTARMAVNTMIVFFVSGVWHGANYTFVLWGILNGILILINRFCGKYVERVPGFIKWIVNFIIVTILWGLFRASGISQWIQLIKKSFSFDGLPVSTELVSSFDAYLPMWLLLALSFGLCLLTENNYNKKIKINTINVVSGAVLLALCLFTLNRTSIFLYFNF